MIDFDDLVHLASTGGLSDYNEKERVKKELDPIIAQLMDKATELNLPMSLVVCYSIDSTAEGIRWGMREVARGREEKGKHRKPALFEALHFVAHNPSMVKRILTHEAMKKFENLVASKDHPKTQRDIDMDNIIQEGIKEE